jgi:hypothetical protein
VSGTYSLDHLFGVLIAFAEDEYDLPYEELWLTKPELATLCAQAVGAMGGLDCIWCGVDTRELGEYYMVADKVWNRYGPASGCLCIGCLEDRMGRQLRRGDFKDIPLNTDPEQHRSDRLRNRLGLGAKVVSE